MLTKKTTPRNGRFESFAEMGWLLNLGCFPGSCLELANHCEFTRSPYFRKTNHRFLWVRVSLQRRSIKETARILSVATPPDPRGEKLFYFVHILGGEELLEKCRPVRIFLAAREGLNILRTHFGSFFRILFFAFFKPFFVSNSEFFGGILVLQTCRANEFQKVPHFRETRELAMSWFVLPGRGAIQYNTVGSRARWPPNRQPMPPYHSLMLFTNSGRPLKRSLVY